MSRSSQFDATINAVLINTTETTVAHGLGRIPLEAFVLYRNTGGIIYRGSTAWDATNIYVQASSTVGAILFIF